MARDNNRVTIDWKGKEKTFTVLQVLEFNSYRRRMSVIAQRDEDGVILVSPNYHIFINPDPN